jgi:DNA repair protein RadC
MVDVGKLVGVPVLDHLIVTRADYCSLAALGMMGGGTLS